MGKFFFIKLVFFSCCPWNCACWCKLIDRGERACICVWCIAFLFLGKPFLRSKPFGEAALDASPDGASTDPDPTDCDNAFISLGVSAPSLSLLPGSCFFSVNSQFYGAEILNWLLWMEDATTRGSLCSLPNCTSCGRASPIDLS